MNEVFGSSLLAFAAISLIVELTPGPNMAYLAAFSLMKGWRGGVAAVAGVALGAGTADRVRPPCGMWHTTTHP